MSAFDKVRKTCRAVVLCVVALALAAALPWTLPADPTQAQEDAARPEITAGPTIIISPASGDVYGPQETIAVALTFSGPVAVTVNQDTGGPRLRLAVGDRKRWAKYDRSDQGGARLIFTYQVKGNDADDDSVSIGGEHQTGRGAPSRTPTATPPG